MVGSDGIVALAIELDHETGRIALPRYPFPTRKTRILERAEIVEAIDWTPPALLTSDGEFLLVPFDHRDALEGFCAAQGIPFGARPDVWNHLLAPFLDTEHEDSWIAALYRMLGDAGFDAAEVDAIRARVRWRMEWLTFATWEWVHYGLYDVLLAMRPQTPLGRGRWRRFYADAMEIALRGVESDPLRSSHLR